MNRMISRFPGLASIWMWAFLAVSLPLAIYAAQKVRPFSLPDESAHYFRTLEVSKLHLINFRGDAGVDIPCEEYKIVGNANGPIANYINVDPMMESATPDRPCMIRSINTAGAYSPVMYVFSATGFAIADHLGLDYVGKHTWGRIFNAIANTIIIFLALCMVNHHYRPLLAAAAFVPMGFWLRSSLSADAVTDAVLLLYICWVIHCLERMATLGPKEKQISIALAILVGSLKPLYSILPFITLILFRRGASMKQQLWLLIPGLVSIVTAFTLTKMFDPSLIYVPQGLVPADQLMYIIQHPLQYASTLFNTLKINYSGLFYGLISTDTHRYSIIVILLLVSTPSLLGGEQRLFLLMMALGLCVAISSALYILYTPIGYTEVYGLQGRLFIIPMTIVVLAAAFEKKHWIFMAPWVRNLIGYFLPLMLIFTSLEDINIMRSMGMG